MSLYYRTISSNYYNIVNGQHTIVAFKKWNGAGWEDVFIECWVYEGLNVKQEAKLFRALNHFRHVCCFDDFLVALTAEASPFVEINEIVRRQGLVITREEVKGRIVAVAALLKSYEHTSPEALEKSLAVIRNSFGEPGILAPIIEGMSFLLHRFNGMLDGRRAVAVLANMHGGVNGLLNAARFLRERNGFTLNACVAAAALNAINRSCKRSEKLAPWWKE